MEGVLYLEGLEGGVWRVDCQIFSLLPLGFS